MTDNQASQCNKPEFREFRKIARFNRRIIITEKIDGTNGLIYIGPDTPGQAPEFLVGSRSRWITPENDNHGFAKWAYEHRCQLVCLGPGYHYGEWWGHGIQRGYGLPKGEKRFSLFNASKWVSVPNLVTGLPESNFPGCCNIVPTLAICDGPELNETIQRVLIDLKVHGSYASPFMDPEGIVIWHMAINSGFKITFENDKKGKTE